MAEPYVEVDEKRTKKSFVDVDEPGNIYCNSIDSSPGMVSCKFYADSGFERTFGFKNVKSIRITKKALPASGKTVLFTRSDFGSGIKAGSTCILFGDTVICRKKGEDVSFFFK
jgi:hypothetical protein